MGLFAPLALTSFRSLWFATVVSNIGTAMQGVAATWLLVEAGADAQTIVWMQAAASFPLFVLGLPAGVLADVVDRRKLLIVANLWMAAVAAALAMAAFAGMAHPAEILAATAGIGIGSALAAPAFQAIVPELAGGAMLTPALTLNSVGTNVARAIGPALGGLAAAVAGAASVFVLNAASTLAVVAALSRWRRTDVAHRLPAEHLVSAARASLRYASAAPGVVRVLLRSMIFFFFASACWALLPLIASERLGLQASGYGSLLAALGAGAVGAAAVMSRAKARFGADRLTDGANALAGISTIAMSSVSSIGAALAVLSLFGAGWIVALTMSNVGVQSAVAGWIRARMLALFVVVYFGTFSLGSLVWGRMAVWVGSQTALLVAGSLGTLSTVVLLRLPTLGGIDLDPLPSLETSLLVGPEDDQGFVLVSNEYRVAPEKAAEFEAALERLKLSRRRTGAIYWHHWSDPSDAGFHRESYIVESWIAHLREGLRRTVSDEQIESTVAALSDPPPQRRILRAARRRTEKR